MPSLSFRGAVAALLGAGVLLGTMPRPARAQKGSGSVVSGTIKIGGAAPKPAAVKVTKDASSCGAEYA